jgi:diadenosine tetraphosphate (Ap4A) HIT family hydrolase
MKFELHPNLTQKIFIHDLPLCTVLLEDERHYPWIFLVPRRPDIRHLIDLTDTDQLQLWQELTLAQTIMRDLFHPTQLNVATLGNKTPQLHLHILARFTQDPAWPNTAWEHPMKEPYPLAQRTDILQRLQQAFSQKK